MKSLRILCPTEEQRLLTLSAFVMGIIGLAGLVIGVWSGSKAVLTDGIFSLIGVVIKLCMLVTARLVARERSVRFQFGYWQMEPLVLCMEGLFILIVIMYAGAVGIMSLAAGGHAVDFGIALYYALFFMIMSGSFYVYLKGKNTALHSNLVHYDVVSWYVDVMLAGGLLLSFGAAWLLGMTPYAEWARFADPVIMLALAIHMIHPALRILLPALRQILGVAPRDVHDHVQTVMEDAGARYGFLDYTTSVQAYGHAKIIDIDILVPHDYPAKGPGDFDQIRNEIDEALGYPDHQQWLTITFTTSRRWMAKMVAK